jgi:hypothetical protein
MEKYFALWNGGAGYSESEAGPDTEIFESLAAVKRELLNRRNGWADITRLDGSTETVRTPCVEDDSEFIVWSDGDGTEFPDCGTRIFFGPRGGIKSEWF